MDQEPSLLPPSLSVPTMVSPGNNDSFDGRAVTISGTADRAVPIRIWDWLSPVAATTADGDGCWSITLYDVEVGDHMYCAEAHRDSPACTARSQFVAVRIVSPPRSSGASARRTPHRWIVPIRSFTHGLTGRRRSESRDGGTTQTGPEERREPVGDIQRPTSASPPAGTPPSVVPSVEDAPPGALPAAGAPMPLDLVPEPAPVEDQRPVEVRMYRVADEPEVIEAPMRATLMTSGPVDLGVADRVSDLVPPIDVATHLVPVPPTRERIWTERIIVEPPPTTRVIDTGG